MPTAMLPADIKRLQSIQSFDSLVNYLRDDLDWPLDEIDIEDLTFDYSPEELGLQQQYVVKLKSIKQLRPLVTHQPWGIFYLEFERKKLPVVVLRRILKELVPKKRESANQAERALWQKQDLLFISSQGEDAHRRLSFAHFRDLPDGRIGLDTFDWDDRETQFAGIGLSLAKLHWPNNVSDVEAWRKGWASAFTRPHGYVAQTSEQLSRALAELAGRTRDLVREIYRVEKKEGALHTLFEAFKAALVHDLSSDTFSDMLAQTVAYGLFAARAETGEVLGLSNLAEMIPATNPFLRELFSEIEKLGDDQESYINFDELGVSNIVQLLNKAKMDAIMEDFGRQTGGGREDPVIHFYESFLKEYDAKQRVERGVFYTPKPVVSFIVRSVDKILQDEFGLPDGLADTTTWGEMQARHPGLTLPKGVSPDAPFVQILDPATGTGTFLETVIDVIWQTMTAKWHKERKTDAQIRALWNEYVPKHLLPRLNGFELMMASYAIAHVKLGLKLKQTGYDFQSGERLRVFLTNTLEEPDELGKQRTMTSAFNFLAHEARDADAVKRHSAITVIVGNPPYAVSSQNKSGWILDLLEEYKKDLEEKKLNLDDDFIKFIRFAQWKLAQATYGTLGFITNHTYLDGITHRRMRESLITTFDKSNIIDLHGNSAKRERNPDGGKDENVFNIQQGVAIGLFAKTIQGSEEHTVRFSELWGTRNAKNDRLTNSNMDTLSWQNVVSIQDASCLGKFFFFRQKTDENVDEYCSGWSLKDVLTVSGSGVKTERDRVSIHETEIGIRNSVKDFRTLDVTRLRQKYNLESDSRDWKVASAKADVIANTNDSLFRPILYRPFDVQHTWYSGKTRGFIGTPGFPTMRHLIRGKNIAMLGIRQYEYDVADYCYIFASDKLAECRVFVSNRGIALAFPLYSFSEDGRQVPNIGVAFLDALLACTGLELAKASVGEAVSSKPMRSSGLPPSLGMFQEYHGLFAGDGQTIRSNAPIINENSVTPEDIFHYAYAIFHSPSYRERYAEFLKIDFPRLPLTSDVPLFRALSALGEQLTALHLMERVGPNPASFPVAGSNSVDAAPKYDAGTQRVSINKTQYFAPVPPKVWAFQIGGYQVCHKWLKDRKGRTLTEEDITHYGSIVAALGETIRLMSEIDAVIEEHDGWPLQ